MYVYVVFVQIFHDSHNTVQYVVLRTRSFVNIQSDTAISCCMYVFGQRCTLYSHVPEAIEAIG